MGLNGSYGSDLAGKKWLRLAICMYVTKHVRGYVILALRLNHHASMNDKAEILWRAHLGDINRPLIHFVPAALLDFPSIGTAVDELGFTLFVIDAREIKSEPDLIEAFAKSMNFPSYFGKNWNAVLDFTRDLSWTKANGYVLVISNGDDLVPLPNRVFASLIAIVEETVTDWRDARGDYRERSGPVSFHMIFSGGEALKEALLGELREPFCEHTTMFSVNIFQTPVLENAVAYRDAERLIDAGADTEMVLSFLREQSVDERDSAYMISGLLGMTIPESKALIYGSQTWPELRDRDEQFRQIARDALRDFGWEE
jgi:hypothetical protein